jgi:hypothetical protein
MTFVGTGIEWFSNLDRSHGIAAVFIDGEKVREVDTWSDVARKQQRIFWKFDLPYGKHIIKITHLGEGRAESPVIDIDALVVTEGHATPLTHGLSDAAAQPRISPQS